MAQTVCVLLDHAVEGQLVAIAGDRSRPLKHILRARIVLLSAARLSVQEVARQAVVSRPAVWRWQQRYGSYAGFWVTAAVRRRGALGAR